MGKPLLQVAFFGLVTVLLIYITAIDTAMTEQDWGDAIELSRMRSQDFPALEQRAMHVFRLVSEEEEAEIIVRVQEKMRGRDIPEFHKCRLMMVLVSRIGMFINEIPVTLFYVGVFVN